MLSEWLRQQAEELEIVLEPTALVQLNRYRSLLQEWNQSLNLTSITDVAEIYELHFLDSLSACSAVDMSEVCSLIDVGSGAGFPGLVLAIVFPAIKVTLLESIKKKARFLQAVVDDLALSERVQVVCERAEVLGQQHIYREQYDVVVARAVARLAVLAEYCLPLVRLGGCFVAQKGPQVEEEVGEAAHCIAVLGGGEVRTWSWSLPSGASRTLVRVNKQKRTPMVYPRRAGVPAKRPLL